MFKRQQSVPVRAIFLGLWIVLTVFIFYRYSVTGLTKERFYGVICCAMVVLNIFQLRSAIKAKKEREEDQRINDAEQIGSDIK